MLVISDLIEEILLRLPPDDPGCLFRASRVCKSWRSLVTGSGFASRYRKFHRTPPLLGFFEIDDLFGCWFAPSSSSSSPLPSIHPDPRDFFVLDSRHGLVLLRTPGWKKDKPPVSFIVWDPVGRRQWEFPPPEFATPVMYDNAVVLCDVDHIGCRGGPFTVAYVATDHNGTAYASLFSSETRAWSSVATISDVYLEILRCQPKTLLGNVVFFACYSNIILRYDLLSRQLSRIDGPGVGEDYYVLVKIEEGVLGCATMEEPGLCLCSMETRPDGALAWMKHRVIELEERLLSSSSRSLTELGFMDGPGVFYLKADSCIFTVELKSGRVKKIFIDRFSAVSGSTLIPYMSFYTPDQAGPRMLPSTMVSSSENVEPDQEKYHDSLLPHSGGQVGDEQGKGEERHGWEEVSAKKECDEEEEHQIEKTAQELFDKGSKANKDGDFVCKVDCLRRELEIRVAHHGKLSPKCFSTYFQYGCALRLKLLLEMASTSMPNDTRYSKDLDLVWRMLHVARSILEKSPGSNMEKVKIFAILAEVSMQGGDIDYSLIACFKALTILQRLVEPGHGHIFYLKLQIRFSFELESKIGDAKAISLCKSRIESLKRANEDFLADKGDHASATEVGSASLAKYIEFFTDILLIALEKKIQLEDLEQVISAPVAEAIGHQNVGNDVPRAASLASSQYSGPSDAMPTGTGLEAAGRGIKRANIKQTSCEPSPKKFAEGSTSVDVDSSNGSDAGSDDASDTELGSASLAKYIEFVADILLVALEKKIQLEDLEQAISSSVAEAIGHRNVGNDVPRAASLASSQYSGPSDAMPTGAGLEAAGRGIKRANVKQTSCEPSPKKFAEGSPSVDVDSSNGSDADSDGSVSE